MERTETQRKILEVGKKEFLEKGFKDASLNKIVAEAGFTKGAFYGYYPDKTALFEDLVGETAKELLTRFKAAQDDYFDLIPEGRAKDSLELSTQHLHELVAFMYDHFDEFKLILCRAEGTGYADFIEVLVELEVDRSEEYYALLRKNGMLSGSMTRQLHHMITRAYFTAVCETIVHNMPREEAMKYVDELAIFFHCSATRFLRNSDRILEKKAPVLRSISEPRSLASAAPKNNRGDPRKRAGFLGSERDGFAAPLFAFSPSW